MASFVLLGIWILSCRVYHFLGNMMDKTRSGHFDNQQTIILRSKIPIPAFEQFLLAYPFSPLSQAFSDLQPSIVFFIFIHCDSLLKSLRWISYHMTNDTIFMMISFSDSMKAFMGNPRFPTRPNTIPNTMENTTNPRTFIFREAISSPAGTIDDPGASSSSFRTV